MHLLIAFAAPLSEAGRQALSTLALPRLQALLAHSQEVERDADDECSLTPPHERALARALGLQGAPGRLPWAAWLVAADGLVTGDQAWGLLTPAHWHLGTEQVSLVDPHALALEEPESRALLQAIAPLFTSLGYALQFGAPLRWYLAHPSLATLATASPDRVIGRNIDAWLGDDAALGPVRRLQSEVQMLLHDHPLNEARQARGALAVNSFWLSGCGVAQRVHGRAPQLDDRLRRPALAEDWPAWQQGWAELDAGPLAALLLAAQQGTVVRLTLCGERAWAAFETRPAGWGRRLRSLWSPPALRPLLEAL
jgi:hypothetical protein